ncbi:hypothetical protein LINPERPRIM_LOCUS33080 [Linum perenne]
MIEAKNNGYRVKTTFSKTGWLKIKNALKDKFNKVYKESQLFNKYGQLRITYNRFKALLSHTGMGYSASTGLVTADEEVWALATKMPCQTSIRQGHEWVRELLHDHPGRIYDRLRMDRHIFVHLCEELKKHGLQHSKNITVEEQVAMFLMILAHSNSARDNAEDFQHSTATVSKYFGIILKSVISLSLVVIVPPNMSEVPPQILNDPKYHPYFKVNI